MYTINVCCFENNFMVHPISLDTEHLKCMTLIAYVRAKFRQVRVWYAPTALWKQTLQNILPQRKIHSMFQERHSVSQDILSCTLQLLEHSENWYNSGGLKQFTSWPFHSRVKCKISAVHGGKKLILLRSSWIIRCLYSVKNSKWLYHKEVLQCCAYFVP